MIFSKSVITKKLSIDIKQNLKKKKNYAPIQKLQSIAFGLGAQIDSQGLYHL